MGLVVPSRAAHDRTFQKVLWHSTVLSRQAQEEWGDIFVFLFSFLNVFGEGCVIPKWQSWNVRAGKRLAGS